VAPSVASVTSRRQVVFEGETVELEAEESAVDAVEPLADLVAESLVEGDQPLGKSFDSCLEILGDDIEVATPSGFRLIDPRSQPRLEACLEPRLGSEDRRQEFLAKSVERGVIHGHGSVLSLVVGTLSIVSVSAHSVTE
ncbi:MAG: hypothetical protein HY216_02785, partial [Candidatus Rokubacteria bacterium]|nr:hypothetical protein [Candidatus Rokubacteria bacterium]